MSHILDHWCPSPVPSTYGCAFLDFERLYRFQSGSFFVTRVNRILRSTPVLASGRSQTGLISTRVSSSRLLLAPDFQAPFRRHPF